MEQSVGMYQLSVQQNIAPAPNESAKVVDWLPHFAGFSWLAYGAHFSVVITMAPLPSNTGEVAMGGFFRQVLSTNWPKDEDEEKEYVISVEWAPRGVSIGSLGAAAGKHIYLYEPKGLTCVEGGHQDFPEIPLRWEKTNVLEHSSTVQSFAWSESGDGLLSVGLEIVMWHKSENCWSSLWRTELDQPQALCAASWSARGIAAAAEGAGSEETQPHDGDHLVKIWWWEDGKELLEVDLEHPERLTMIQWRPMRGRDSSFPFRPVLLTCCRDGVVRLWAEISNIGFSEAGNSSQAIPANSGRNTAVQEVGNGSENQFKLAFFVSAVIDANTTLKGVLGHDIHITWPEGRGGGSRTSNGDKAESVGGVSKDSEVAMNEWVIGIGPFGSIALWSVQSLDDLSPTRGPILQLWHQRSGLLPSPSVGNNVGIEGQSSPQAVKVVVHRPVGTFWGPPSSLDVFEIWSPHLLRWSCIWPPVSAIGGPSSKHIASNSGSANAVGAAGKPSPWGVSSEVVVVGGHQGNITQIAVHPIAALRLVASLDDQGTVLFWDAMGPSFSPRSEVIGCLNPLWRSSGQMAHNQVDCSGLFNSMAWAPVNLPRDDTVLLLSHSQGVDCVLISKKVYLSRGKFKTFFVSHIHLYTLEWPFLDDKYGLQGIYTAPSRLAISEDKPYTKTCIMVGIGNDGLKLASWKLEIQLHIVVKDRHRLSEDKRNPEVQEEVEDIDDTPKYSVTVGGDTIELEDVLPLDNSNPLDSSVQKLVMNFYLLGILNMGTGEKVTSIAAAASGHLLGGHSGSLSDFNEVCDIVTGCADGALRLWKVWDGTSINSLLSLEKAGGWQCVALLRCYDGPVSQVAFCSVTTKIASIGNAPEETAEVIYIWGADTFNEERGFGLEGKICLSSPAVSLDWFDGGNGLSILGVTCKKNVQLFAECRDQVLQSGRKLSSGLSEGNLWTCIAASPATGFSTSNLSWEAQGSLVVTCGAHILLYSNCVLPQPSYLPASAMQTPSKGKSQLSNSRAISAYGSLHAHGNGTGIQSALRPGEEEKSNQAKEFCSILEAVEGIGCPLPDYHPASLLSWISGGSRQQARASVRHLAFCLIAVSKAAVHKGISEAEAGVSVQKVSRTPLSEVFQERDQLITSQGQHNSKQGGGQSEPGRIAGNSSTTSRTSFLEFSAAYNSDYREEDQKLPKDPRLIVKRGGFEPFTKVEFELISNVVRDSGTIPGLSADEKLQLQAIIDVLSDLDGLSQPSLINGLDLPALRFWLEFHYSVRYAHWKKDESDKKIVAMESKAMAWALQSEFKENLAALCIPDQSMSWPAMRALGMGYWFTGVAELRNKMEKLARAQYLQKKDPKDCALMYLALDRRTVLCGLFKISRDQKDRPLAEFLFRDFKDEKNKVAALKNAYVLMGKHRHELAASFFLLGGDINSAAVVCAKNLGDPQLGLLVATLLEGVNGSIGRDIILKYGLPIAKDTKDRWLASMLQWKLGKGIESIQELNLNFHKDSTPSPQTDKGRLEAVFPLDPDLGRYCELLAFKPRVQNSEVAVEASAMATIATTRSAAAMKRTGLSLQALEYLRHSHSAHIIKTGGEHPNDIFSNRGSSGDSTSMSPSSHFPITDISGRQVGSGWLSPDVVTGIRLATRSSLVLQCASQLLQDHPHWGGQSCSAWQDPVISGVLPKQMETSKSRRLSEKFDVGTILDKSAKQTDLSTYLEEADKLFDNDVQLLSTKYSVEVEGIVAPLSTLSRIHHRPYILHRLVHGLWNLKNSPDRGFHLASQSSMAVSVGQYLEAFGTEAPHVLAWTVLSCGGAAAPQELGIVEALNRKDGDNSTPAADGALPGFSYEELVRFGGEIQLLAEAARHERSHFGKERVVQTLTLQSFIFFVAAAWLGRQTKALFKLVAPTVSDLLTPPEVPQGQFDAVVWFRRLELEGFPSQRPGKNPVEPVGFNMAGNAIIPGDDAWRLLGVSLWTHLLIYVKKQLTGVASEAAYSSFVRVASSSASPIKPSSQGTKGATFLGLIQSSTWLDFKSKVRDTYQTLPPGLAAGDGGGIGEGRINMGKPPVSDGNVSSTADNDNFEVALLGTLKSIVAGLRKQLAGHLERSLNKSDSDPLTLWLWGRPSPLTSAKKPAGGSTLKFFNASSSNGVVGVSALSSVNVYSQSPSNLFPSAVIATDDKVLKDLWEVLVVREKVCSALGLEGVNGQRKKQENENISEWYTGKQGQVLATKTGSGGIGKSVNTYCRLPPKRIMWNADQGVTLTSRREEERAQLKTLASEDLHLSEEFSEARLEGPLPTVKKFAPLPGNLDQRHG